MVEALLDRGHEILVVTSSASRLLPPEQQVRRNLLYLRPDLPQPYGGSDPTDQAVALHRARGNVINAHNVAMVLSAIEGFQPDALYLWNIDGIGGLGIAAAVAMLQLPTVWHLMDAVPNQGVFLTPRSAVGAAQILRALSRRLRAVYIACSQRVAKEISDPGFEFGENLKIVPNWVTPPRHQLDRHYFESRTQTLKVVSAGQLVPQKGVHHVIEAAALLVRDGRVDFQVELFGSGLEHHFAEMIVRNGVQRFVSLRGYLPQDELVEEYWTRDIFLMPTWRREPFGFAALEAARRGCLTIISQDCGYAEWFVDGLHCIKTSPTPEGIATKLGQILDGKIEIKSIARRAMHVVQDEFSIHRVIPAVEDAFENALRLPVRRPSSLNDAYLWARLAEHVLMSHLEVT
jgi:glycosyltransferase involved in cell wall biosynthesis